MAEPGMGKSRLVWEITHSPRTQGWLILEAGSVSHGKATAYLPVVDLLKGYCRIEPGDDPRRIREKLAGKLLALDPGLLPALLALFDVPTGDAAWEALDASLRRHRTRESVRHVFLREAQVQPLLIVVEDLHWTDGETQAILDALVESLPTARILLLTNYRPEYSHPWGRKTYCSQLRLDPLSSESSEELLDALLGPDPSLDGLRRLLIERTEGNPFFLEESVRALLEGNALAGERGAYRLTRAIGAVQVPATVQSVIAARIDRLSPENKRLLQASSVIGKDVPLTLLESLDVEPVDVAHRALSELQDAEFLYQTQLFPGAEYTFKHALTHEVVYGSLLQEKRRSLHAGIVDAIEELHAGRLAEQVEQLAHHALRGEIWERAVSYCTTAAEKAMRRSAFREAATWQEHALRALTHLPETRERLEQGIDLRLSLRNSLQPVGELRRVIEYLSEAEPALERLGDQRRLCMLWSCLANCHWAMGQHQRGIEPGHRAVRSAATTGDPHLLIGARWNLTMPYWGRGDYRRALRYVMENHAALEAGALSRVDVSAIPGSSTHPAVGNRAVGAWCLAEAR